MLNRVICLIAGIAILGGFVQTYRLECYRERYNELAERARVTTELCERYAREASEADSNLQRIAGSIQHSISITGRIQEQLREIKAYTELLEDRNNKLRADNLRLLYIIMEDKTMINYVSGNWILEGKEFVENFDKAVADKDNTWVLHHRLETRNSDGERRTIDITREELDALGMLKFRPANEFIYMTKQDHMKEHLNGKPARSRGSLSKFARGEAEEPYKYKRFKRLSAEEAHKYFRQYKYQGGNLTWYEYRYFINNYIGGDYTKVGLAVYLSRDYDPVTRKYK